MFYSSIWVFALLAAALVIHLVSKRAENEARRQEKQDEIDRLTREVDLNERDLLEIRATIRALQTHKVLNGEKCQSCGEYEHVSTVKPISGENGRVVPLCSKCREVIGASDDEYPTEEI